MMNSTIIGIACGTALLLAVLAGIFMLAWHGVLTGGEALGVVSAIVGIAGGAFAVHAGVQAGSNAAVGPPGTTTTRAK